MAQDPGRAGAEPIEIAPELRNTEQHAVDETRPLSQYLDQVSTVFVLLGSAQESRNDGALLWRVSIAVLSRSRMSPLWRGLGHSYGLKTGY